MSNVGQGGLFGLNYENLAAGEKSREVEHCGEAKRIPVKILSDGTRNSRVCRTTLPTILILNLLLPPFARLFHGSCSASMFLKFLIIASASSDSTRGISEAI